MKQYFSIIMICALCLTSMLAHASSKTDDNEFKIYPNPIQRGAVLTVEIPTNKYGEVYVKLYNTVGKVIQSQKTTDNIVEFNAPEISGIYLLRIIEKQKVVAVEKIIVRE